MVRGVAVNLRRVAKANREMKAKGWKGLVAYIQSPRGTGICEYRELKPVPGVDYAAWNSKLRSKRHGKVR